MHCSNPTHDIYYLLSNHIKFNAVQEVYCCYLLFNSLLPALLLQIVQGLCAGGSDTGNTGAGGFAAER